MSKAVKSFLPVRFNENERNLEHDLFLEAPLKLTRKDVYSTLHDHIKLYEQFVYTTREAVYDLFYSCMFRS